MTSPDLPRPITTDQKILMALVTRLDDQNALLTRMLDRLPEPPAPADGKGAVELREPAPLAAEQTPAAEPEQASKPAPARRPRKTTSKGKTPGKGSA